MLIRTWRDGDSAALLTELLHRAYAPLGASGWNYTAVDQTVDDTHHRIGLGTCAVAVADDAIVGTVTVRRAGESESACAWYRRTDVAMANQFAVDPAWQGRGAGSRLMAWAEAWARANGFAELAVDTAEPALPLVAYYVRRGFRRVDDVQWPGKRYRSAVLSKALQEGSMSLPSVRRLDRGVEHSTAERCFINELSNSGGDAACSIARARVTAGVTTRWHTLDGIVERYVILEGCGRAEVGDVVADVGPGDVVLIPAQCRQRIVNTGDGDLVFLAICTPRFRPEAYLDIDSLEPS